MLSVLTPTRNRFNEFHLAVECMRHQNFIGKIEWVIVEDGDQDVRPLLTELPENVEINYSRLDGVSPIGKKRNACVDQAREQICVFWDDDDYYHEDYLSETYHLLTSQFVYGVLGSSILIAYDLSSNIFYSVGKHGNHSPNGVIAFTKKAMRQYDLKYRDKDTHGEERYFLKDFCVPLLHRNPMKSIVAIQHGNNTWNVKFREEDKMGYEFPDWAKKCIETYFSYNNKDDVRSTS